MLRLYFFAALLIIFCEANAVAIWTGGAGSPTNIWSEPTNWSTGQAPASATVRGTNDDNVARMPFIGTTTLIDASVNAVAFGVHVGHPIAGDTASRSASNTLNMTGGTLTTQGNFLFNVGRGRTDDPNHLVRFNMSGGVVNAAGITVPEAFDPNSVLGFVSTGLNAEMHVSGNSIINTDLLRLGAQDANSLVVLSDHAQVNLTDDNGGFANGALWIEAFEMPVLGMSLLDIRDHAVLTIHGEWWTDENANGNRDAATMSELQYFRDNYIANGWIVANGGAGTLETSYANGVITMRVANEAVPEPNVLIVFCAGLLGLGVLKRIKMS